MDSQRSFLLLIVGSLLFIAGLMLKPFLGYILGAVLIAFILMPLQNRLSNYIGERLSAFTLITLTLLTLTLPFLLIFGSVYEDAQDVIGSVNSSEVVETTEIEEFIFEYTGQRTDIENRVQSSLNKFVSVTIGNASMYLNLAMEIGIGISIVLFLLYYLLKDGRRFTNYIKSLIPLPKDLIIRIQNETYVTTWAVVKGHILVAITQGTLAGMGLWMTGVPNYAFWTFIMIILAFIPIIGAFLIWGPASFYLFMTSRPLAGTLLFLYGAIVVSLTDNFLRPILVDRETDLHPAVILIGVLGGLSVFGAAGMFVGPIILGVLKAILEVFNENFEELNKP